jgi:hypothetical protein
MGEAAVATYLIAPPGTLKGEPGWVEPTDGLELRWSSGGYRPPFWVMRDGVLITDGRLGDLYFPPCGCGRAEIHLAGPDCDPLTG